MKDNPLINPDADLNRQQLAIRAIKSVLRQDYSNWEMIIVDDCSNSWEQLQQYVTALNDPRITYIHNDINSGACAVRNQAIMLAQGEYITGIDDDDEWTTQPSEASSLPINSNWSHTPFCTLTTTFARAKAYPQPASLPLYPKSPTTPPVLQTQYHWQSGLYLGMAFQRLFVRYRTKSGTGLRHLPADGGGDGEPWKVEEATQILHINHGEMQITSTKKFSGYFHFYRNKRNLTVPVKRSAR